MDTENDRQEALSSQKTYSTVNTGSGEIAAIQEISVSLGVAVSNAWRQLGNGSRFRNYGTGAIF